MKHNEIRNKIARGQLSARQYHPTHVGETTQNPLGRIRLGVCGTFIHEDGPPAQSIPRHARRSRPPSVASSRHSSRGGSGAGGSRRGGELERAGGLSRFEAPHTGRSHASARSSARLSTGRSRGSLASAGSAVGGGVGAGAGAPQASWRSARGGTASARSSASSALLRERLEHETKARVKAEEQITLLSLELQRLKASLALRA